MVTCRNFSSAHMALMFLFLLGVIFTIQQSRGKFGSVAPRRLDAGAAAAADANRIGPSPPTIPQLVPTPNAKFELDRERREVEDEDRLKEDIPMLMRRPVKRPRQAMNNLTSGAYWAYGSWGRITATSSACWAYPSVDSFAVQCKKKLLPLSVMIKVEHLQQLEVLKAVCVSCGDRQAAQRDVVMSDATGAGAAKKNSLVRQVGSTPRPQTSEDAAASNPFLNEGDSSTFVVGREVPRSLVTTSTFAVDGAESCRVQGTFRGMCIVSIDILFRVRAGSGAAKQEKPSSKSKGTSSSKSKKVEDAALGGPPPEVCFLTIGDWGGATPNKTLVARTLVQIVHRRVIKFIVSTGDNFYPTGVQSVNDLQWLQTFELPFNDVALQRLRWFICAGNHDQWGLPPQRDYAVEHPRWYFPKFHYNESIPLYRDAIKHSQETIELAVLNTAGRDTWSQCEMMDEFFTTVEDRHGGYLHDMSRHWRLVVNHEPLFSGGMHGTSNRNKMLRDHFQPYMQQNLVHAYFNGDDHFLEIHRSNGTDYFTSGGGGGSHSYFTVEAMPQTALFQLKGRDTLTGFMMHCMNEGVMHSTLIDGFTGEVVFTHKTQYFVDLKDFGLE